MAERVEASIPEGEETIEERHVGAMWELEQKLDQPMDEEANKLKNMYRGGKVCMILISIFIHKKKVHVFKKKSLSLCVCFRQDLSLLMLLRLSFQSLGIVYGDLGTSPLYVFYNTFPNGIDDPEDVIGALSLIIYSLFLIPLIKYVFIVCKANDNGQGKAKKRRLIDVLKPTDYVYALSDGLIVVCRWDFSDILVAL